MPTAHMLKDIGLRWTTGYRGSAARKVSSEGLNHSSGGSNSSGIARIRPMACRRRIRIGLSLAWTTVCLMKYAFSQVTGDSLPLSVTATSGGLGSCIDSCFRPGKESHEEEIIDSAPMHAGGCYFMDGVGIWRFRPGAVP